MNVLAAFILSAYCLGTIVAHEKCTQIHLCVFQTSKGFIDLTPLEKIEYVDDRIDYQEEYQFNPCREFSCGGDAVLACHVTSQFAINLVDAQTNVTCIDKKEHNDTAVLEYKGNGIELSVTLQCTDEDHPHLVYDEKTSRGNVYNFILSSSDACEHEFTTTTTAPSSSTTTATHTTSTKMTTATTTPTKTSQITTPGNITTASTRRTNTTVTSTPHTATTKTTMPSSSTSQTTAPTHKTTVTTTSVTNTTDGTPKALRPLGMLIALSLVVHLYQVHC